MPKAMTPDQIKAIDLKELCMRDWPLLPHLIWAAIVEYANSGDVEDFRRMVLLALCLMEEGSDWLELELFGDMEEGASLESLAAQYHAPFTNLLKWQSDLKRFESLGPAAFEFQKYQCAGIEMHQEPHTEVSYIEWAKEIDTVVVPVCLFIKKQGDRRDEDDVQFPIRVCETPTCGRFFLMSDPRQHYHAEDCRRSHNASIRPKSSEKQKIEKRKARARPLRP